MGRTKWVSREERNEEVEERKGKSNRREKKRKERYSVKAEVDPADWQMEQTTRDADREVGIEIDKANKVTRLHDVIVRQEPTAKKVSRSKTGVSKSKDK